MENEYICRCSLVTEEEIIDAVINNGVTTVEELKADTMATCGCGKCTIMCNHIIKQTIASKD